MSYLNKNLEMLKIVNPTLAKTLTKAKKPDYLKFHQKDGELLNIIVSKNNQNRLIYEEDNSIKNIDKTLESTFRMYKDTATILVGIGAGHLLKRALEKKDKKHILVIVETIPYLIKAMMEREDMQDYIRDGEVLFACPGNDEVNAVISLVDTSYVINEYNIVADNMAIKCIDRYTKVLSYCFDVINQIQCNTGTVVGAGNMFAENDIKTFASVFLHRGVNELEDIYKDKPAILVNTGPSLQKNIHYLMDEKNRDKYIIIAIAQTLRILLAYGIRPDFITTVDYCKTNIEHFHGLWDCGIPLIALNKTYSPILQKWQGAKFIAGSSYTDYPNTISSMIGEKGMVEQGGSVSHMTFGCALVMGCNPIITIGQDLGFEGDLSHNPNADASGTVKMEGEQLLWDVDSPDSHLKGESHTLGNMINIEGYWGTHVKTGMGLLSFKTSFEKMFQVHEKEKTIINATEGGAHINHAKKMQLKDAIKKYCKEPIDKSCIDKLLTTDKDKEDELIKRALKCLDSEITAFKGMKKNAKKAIECNKKMMTYFNSNKKKLRKNMEENHKYSSEAEKIAKKNPTMSLAIYYAQRAIFSRELNVDGKADNLIENKKDLKTRCDRNKLILEAAIKASNELIPFYEAERKKIRKYKDTRDMSCIFTKIDDPVFKPEDAQKWFDKDNFAFPLLAATRLQWSISSKCPGYSALKDILKTAKEMRTEAINKAKLLPDRKNDLKYMELIKKAHKIGKEKKNYTKALPLLERAAKLKTTHNNERAIWGCATSYFILKDTDKAIEWYKKLIDLCPANLRYKFEYGCIMLNVDLEKGLDVIKEVFEKTKEFDFFYKSIGDLLESNGRNDEAMEAYKEYIKSYPDDIGVKEKISE